MYSVHSTTTYSEVDKSHAQIGGKACCRSACDLCVFTIELKSVGIKSKTQAELSFFSVFVNMAAMH